MPDSLHESVVVPAATALTLVPSALLLAVLFRRWRRQAPLPHVLAVFAFSMLTISPVGLLEDQAWRLLSTLPVAGLAWFAVDNLSVGIVEEGVKFAFFLMLIRGPRRPTPISHAVLYAVAVSLGFAAMENMYYAREAYDDGTLGAFLGMRGLIATPAHMQDGVLMGFLAGLAVTATSRSSRNLCWTLSLALPTVSHAMYDYSATLANEYSVVPPLLSTLAMFAAFAQVIGGCFVAVALIRRSLPQATSRTRSPAPSSPSSLPKQALDSCPACSALGPDPQLPCRRCGNSSEPVVVGTVR